MINGPIEKVFISHLPKAEESKGQKLTRNIAVPVTEEYKQKYEELQRLTGEEFIKTMRAVMIAVIDETKKRLL